MGWASGGILYIQQRLILSFNEEYLSVTLIQGKHPLRALSELPVSRKKRCPAK